jgi:hypothetical protein
MECSSKTPSLPEFKVANCVTITCSLSSPYFTNLFKNETKHSEPELHSYNSASIRSLFEHDRNYSVIRALFVTTFFNRKSCDEV